MLARDLQDNFYEFFQLYFSTLVELIDPLNSELIEAIFTTFSYFFKFLQRFLLNDIKITFE
jgi:hypothetical protein